MTELSDADLVARFQRGDRLAFAALVRRWEGFLLRVAARVTGDLSEAEEVRQAIFLRLLESPRLVGRPDRFEAWLRRAAVNEAIGSVRRRNRRAGAIDRLWSRAPVPETPGPGETLASADEAARLRAELDKLKPDERALLSLRFDEGLTFAEIAEALGMPASTVKSRAAKLVARLRTRLDMAPDG